MRKAISIAILAIFIITSVKSPAAAQLSDGPDLRLPAPGVMVQLSPAFNPAQLQGITIHPDNALQFDFLVQKGDQELEGEQKKEEYKKLVKYFLASLTIPDGDQWVNLSPYENNRIIKDDFGKTEMGRDLLAEDYLLKQITSSLIYPEEGLGKKFWDKIYERAWSEYHTTDIPVNTFNKVWIVPDQAMVYESGNSAYILKSHLKVMLEEDYVSLNKHQSQLSSAHTIGSQVIREIILPELEREVNEGKNFAALRQMYSGMILATWYKKALKESLLGQIYADKAKVKGVDQDPKNNAAIYERYLKAFKKGVFNYIKEDVDRYTNEPIPRKYFSGGFDRAMAPPIRILNKEYPPDAAMITSIFHRFSLLELARVNLKVAPHSGSATSKKDDAIKLKQGKTREIEYESPIIIRLENGMLMVVRASQIPPWDPAYRKIRYNNDYVITDLHEGYEYLRNGDTVVLGKKSRNFKFKGDEFKQGQTGLLIEAIERTGLQVPAGIDAIDRLNKSLEDRLFGNKLLEMAQNDQLNEEALAVIYQKPLAKERTLSPEEIRLILEAIYPETPKMEKNGHFGWLDDDKLQITIKRDGDQITLIGGEVGSLITFGEPAISKDEVNVSVFINVLKKDANVLISNELHKYTNDLDKVTPEILAKVLDEIVESDFYTQINFDQYKSSLDKKTQVILKRTLGKYSALAEKDLIRVNKALLEAIYSTNILNFEDDFRNIPEFIDILKKDPNVVICNELYRYTDNLDEVTPEILAKVLDDLLRGDFYERINSVLYASSFDEKMDWLLDDVLQKGPELTAKDYMRLNRALLEAIYSPQILKRRSPQLEAEEQLVLNGWRGRFKNALDKGDLKETLNVLVQVAKYANSLKNYGPNDFRASERKIFVNAFQLYDLFQEQNTRRLLVKMEARFKKALDKGDLETAFSILSQFAAHGDRFDSKERQILKEAMDTLDQIIKNYKGKGTGEGVQMMAKLKAYLHAFVQNKITRSSKKDAAMNVQSKDKASIAEPGGIDFNSGNLDLQIKRDGHGMALPLAWQDMGQLSRIEGFEPEIIEIKPAGNVPIISELQQRSHASAS